MSWSGLAIRVSIARIGEHGAFLDERLESPGEERLEPGQVVVSHLVDGEDDDETWPDREGGRRLGRLSAPGEGQCQSEEKKSGSHTTQD